MKHFAHWSRLAPKALFQVEARLLTIPSLRRLDEQHFGKRGVLCEGRVEQAAND